MSFELESTPSFDKWLRKLKDKPTRYKVASRLDRAVEGNFGDHKQLSSQLYEFRFVIGGGLRIYYTIRGNKIVLLLTGGNKSSQSKDIATAKDMLNKLE